MAKCPYYGTVTDKGYCIPNKQSSIFESLKMNGECCDAKWHDVSQ